jgi:hypothetical protein
VNGNLRNYSTWSGGLKSLISELSRYSDSDVALSVLRNYGCNTFEKEFVVLDYLTRAFGREISAGAVLGDLDVEVR